MAANRQLLDAFSEICARLEGVLPIGRLVSSEDVVEAIANDPGFRPLFEQLFGAKEYRSVKARSWEQIEKCSRELIEAGLPVCVKRKDGWWMLVCHNRPKSREILARYTSGDTLRGEK